MKQKTLTQLKISLALLLALAGGIAFASTYGAKDEGKAVTGEASKKAMHDKSANIKTAIFAGGCFWCMEPPYDKLEGVIKTVSGYSGGHTENPKYRQISRGGTGHYEVVQVTYNADVVDYGTLLQVFWQNIDPFDGRGQFCDKGQHYTSAIFYGDDSEYTLAQKSLSNTQTSLNVVHGDGNEIQTKILKKVTFYPAEKYHQDYYKKNPIRYKYYRTGCGRDKRLKAVWKDVVVK